MGQMDFHSMGKLWENTNISNLFIFFNILGEAEIHTIPKTSEKSIPIVQEKYRKKQTFQS